MRQLYTQLSWCFSCWHRTGRRISRYLWSLFFHMSTLKKLKAGLKCLQVESSTEWSSCLSQLPWLIVLAVFSIQHQQQQQQQQKYKYNLFSNGTMSNLVYQYRNNAQMMPTISVGSFLRVRFKYTTDCQVSRSRLYLLVQSILFHFISNSLPGMQKSSTWVGCAHSPAEFVCVTWQSKLATSLGFLLHALLIESWKVPGTFKAEV